MREDKLIEASPREDQAPPAPAPAQIERHTRIDFPGECVYEEKVELKVQLTRGVPERTNADEVVRLAVEPGVQEVTLEVQVTAPAFAIQSGQRKMQLPVDGDSEELSFWLVPFRYGEQVVEIEIFFHGARVGYVLLKTEVVGSLRRGGPCGVAAMADPLRELGRFFASPSEQERRVLAVAWSDTDGRLEYRLLPETESGSAPWTVDNAALPAAVKASLQDLNSLLTEVARAADPGAEEWESIRLNLQGTGETLFRLLIPAALAAQVFSWAAGSLLLISTNEQWVPWELLFDGAAFWGERFVVARLPRLSADGRWPDASRPQAAPNGRLRRAVNVVGGGVPRAAAQRAAGLFARLLPAVPVELLEQQTVAALKTAVAGAGLLHFTCHGRHEPYLLQVAKDKSRLLNLAPDTVQRLPLEPGSFVFANACDSAAPHLTFGKFTSFGWEFYRRGAEAFVGTLGAVPVDHAIAFAEAVYTELLRPGGRRTLGQALHAARSAAARERNLFWLFYCLYGDPDYALDIQPD